MPRWQPPLALLAAVGDSSVASSAATVPFLIQSYGKSRCPPDELLAVPAGLACLSDVALCLLPMPAASALGLALVDLVGGHSDLPE
jgi:hypothetical protein